MFETVTSLFNKNSLLYSSEIVYKNEGPSCVDGKGENTDSAQNGQPESAPILAVREK